MAPDRCIQSDTGLLVRGSDGAGVGQPWDTDAVSGETDNSSGGADPAVGVPASVRLEEYARHLQSGPRAASTNCGDCGAARHFEQWILRSGRDIRFVSDRDLVAYREARRKRRQRRSCSSAKLLNKDVAAAKRYLRYLEETGWVDHPGEEALAESLLGDFFAERQKLGYGHGPCQSLLSHCRHFLRWLHISRVSIRTVGRQAAADFRAHDCVCDGNTRHRSPLGRSLSRRYIVAFIDYLAKQGVIQPESEPDPEAGAPELLREYLAWLRNERGLCEATVQTHRRHVSRLFADLGWHPSRYDVTRIRRALEEAHSTVSHAMARHLSTSLRLFLRYLVVKRLCPAQWLAVVPRARHVASADLPRYISEEEVERVLASCDLTTATGLRDRAILLLLSRLGFRVGDIASLRPGDIDWPNARIVVCGKNRREAALPLPQEVGDAILAYLKVRPRVSHDELFLLVRAPYGPFSSPASVSGVVLRALRRSGVENPPSRGGHLLRHSFATHALAAGASLEAIGAVLRHASPTTTALYAKVGLPALAAIAQPWIDAGADA